MRFYLPIPDIAKDIFRYDPTTGIVTRSVTRGPMVAGSAVGSFDEGYLRVRVGRHLYLLHRVAWFLHYGTQPSAHVDHKNGKTTENWIGNLRDATPSQNAANRRRHRTNKAGAKGVCRTFGSNSYRAYVSISGKVTHLGTFDTIESAAAAYLSAARGEFGEFAREDLSI